MNQNIPQTMHRSKIIMNNRYKYKNEYITFKKEHGHITTFFKVGNNVIYNTKNKCQKESKKRKNKRKLKVIHCVSKNSTKNIKNSTQVIRENIFRIIHVIK